MTREHRDLESQGHLLNTDVLVLGGGLSGLWSSIKAREYVEDVLVVDKGPLHWGGLGSFCGADMDVWDPEVSIDKWVDDLVFYFDGLIEQDIIESLLRASYDRFLDYESMGHKFARDQDNNLIRVNQRGLEHFNSLLVRPFGSGGKSLISALVNKVKQLNVRHLSRIQITDIIKDNDTVAGAVGFNSRSGEFYIIKAKSVIICTGNASWKPSYCINTCAGEGFAIALEAGVRMRNFEFVKVWNAPKDFAWEGQTMLLPLGARFVNALNEDFMQKYSPKLGAKMDPHYNTRAMAEEYLAGRGPTFLDTSGMSKENVELLTPTDGWIGLNYNRLKEMGIDFFKDKIEWIPQLNYNVGGIDADAEGQTNIKGIFAAGRARSLEPGVYLGGWSVSGTATTGFIAGQHAGKLAASLSHQPKIDPALTASLKQKIFTPLNKPGFPPKELLNKVREIASPYNVSILKTEQGLTDALNKLKEVETDFLPRMTAASPHFLMKGNEVKSIALVTRLFIESSLLRKETRCGHHRTDFPRRDDQYLGWFLVSKEGDKIVRSFRPVPVEKYKIKPYRYYSDYYQSPN